jgi:5'-nucleotidase
MIKHILVTNDDGIDAKGIKHLTSIARRLAERVTVIAPDSVRSGMGMAISSLHSHISLTLRKEEPNYREFVCSGTPVDCVKTGLLIHFKDASPDLILSGINHGSNAASNVIYSGTMGAAIEGSISKIPSIGFSLLDYDPDADFDQATQYIEDIVKKLYKSYGTDTPNTTTFNVNIPALKREEIKGVKFCHQARAYWKEYFDERKKADGTSEYRLLGDFVYNGDQPDSDIHALEQGYISIVPVQYDMTDYKQLGVRS